MLLPPSHGPRVRPLTFNTLNLLPVYTLREGPLSPWSSKVVNNVVVLSQPHKGKGLHGGAGRLPGGVSGRIMC